MITSADEQILRNRITWLKQKLAAQRNPDNPERTSNPLLIGRTEGNIGALEWALRELTQPSKTIAEFQAENPSSRYD